jgi:hypothetical protein
MYSVHTALSLSPNVVRNDRNDCWEITELRPWFYIWGFPLHTPLKCDDSCVDVHHTAVEHLAFGVVEDLAIQDAWTAEFEQQMYIHGAHTTFNP